ncbi:MAG: hypothetical protein K8F34_01490, partial [Candidatus Kuenenia stuttgartiensis]|nr:hypothetical protein [Candidatus Kuenenia stuttgartiensis]
MTQSVRLGNGIVCEAPASNGKGNEPMMSAWRFFWGVFPIFCDFRHVLMKRCSSVNPDRVSNPVRVVLPRLHERLQTIGNA